MNTYVIIKNKNIGALYFTYYVKANSISRVLQWAEEHISGSYTVHELRDYNNLVNSIEERAIEI